VFSFLSCLSVINTRESRRFSFFLSLSLPRSPVLNQVNRLVDVELALLKIPKISQTVADYSCLHLHVCFFLRISVNIYTETIRLYIQLRLLSFLSTTRLIYSYLYE